jgi:t-SNARE complex subunit (syntaxin)
MVTYVYAFEITSGSPMLLRPDLQEMNKNLIKVNSNIKTLNNDVVDVNDNIKALNKSVLQLNESSTVYSKKMYFLTWVLVVMTAVMVIDVFARLLSVFKKHT